MEQVFADLEMELFLEENGEMIYQMAQAYCILEIMKLLNVNLIMDKFQMEELNF